jgi:SAM-dependent methyltransferase
MTLPPEYFDDLYGHQPDPWGFRDRWYEKRKRRLTMVALPDEHYTSVFEPGCSIGLLSAELARRSNHVLAMDISPAALRQAAEEVPANVELVRGRVPSDWPDRTFDLVVLSEVGYYLDPRDCQQLAELAVTSARDLVAVHWRHPVGDYPLRGDEVHEYLAQCASAHGLASVLTHLEVDVRLEVWSRDHRSVAARTGLV